MWPRALTASPPPFDTARASYIASRDHEIGARAVHFGATKPRRGTAHGPVHLDAYHHRVQRHRVLPPGIPQYRRTPITFCDSQNVCFVMFARSVACRIDNIRPGGVRARATTMFDTRQSSRASRRTPQTQVKIRTYQNLAVETLFERMCHARVGSSFVALPINDANGTGAFYSLLSSTLILWSPACPQTPRSNRL